MLYYTGDIRPCTKINQRLKYFRRDDGVGSKLVSVLLSNNFYLSISTSTAKLCSNLNKLHYCVWELPFMSLQCGFTQD